MELDPLYLCETYAFKCAEIVPVFAHNPVVSGLGIYRRGKNVVFEDLPSQKDLQTTLGTSKLPDFIKLRSDSKADTVVIPKRVWTEAKKRQIPFVVLD